jgi:hypothetical protein
MKKNLILQIIYLFLAMISLWFLQNELLITIAIIILIVLTLLVDYKEKEWIWLVIGIVVGAAVEIIGDQLYQLQHWEDTLLLTVPLWLPLFWGYVFVVVRRFGNKIVKK